MNPDAPAPRAPADAAKPMSYRDAGVDIDAGEALVEDIKQVVARTQRPEVLGGIGGFGALVGLPTKYKNPVLVSGTDGVGTKLRVGIDTGRVEGLGIDLVAMCVNDVLVNGAEPLFFLDYFATGKLDKHVAGRVIRGIAEGCHQAGAALVGGETAEMPGMYARGDFDLAGFCVAVVERDGIIDGRTIAPGHRLVALASSGPHSNGYSLIRRVVERSGLGFDDALPGGRGETLGDALIAPTRIYVRSVLKLLDAGVPVAGMAHITGGGITENLPRVLPAGVGARIERSSWARPAVFQWLAAAGPVDEAEMLRTFNCGIGFVLVLAPEVVDTALASLLASGETAWVCGEIVADASGSVAYA